MDKEKLNLIKARKTGLDIQIIDKILPKVTCETIVNWIENGTIEMTDCRDGEFINQFKGSLDNHKSLIDYIWKVVKPLVPKIKGKKAIGINEHLAVVKYLPGGFIRSHQDYTYTKVSNNSETEYTISIYLNESFTGGKTRFYTTNKQKNILNVTPKTGKAIIFRQGEGKVGVRHAGATVKIGIKYVLRASVLFKNLKNK